MKTSLKIGLFLAAAAVGLAAQAAGIDVRSMLSPEVALGLAGAGALLTTKYSQSGQVIDYVNTTGAAIAAGAVVKMSHVLGIALADIAIGATGSVQIKGIFKEVPKVTGAVWLQGESLLWDVSAGKFDDAAAVAASGDVFGSAVAATAGANGETTALVYFTGNPGVLTA
jgi:predicted RecA/RadA family phage recombinase